MAGEYRLFFISEVPPLTLFDLLIRLCLPDFPKNAETLFSQRQWLDFVLSYSVSGFLFAYKSTCSAQ